MSRSKVHRLIMSHRYIVITSRLKRHRPIMITSRSKGYTNINNFKRSEMGNYPIRDHLTWEITLKESSIKDLLLTLLVGKMILALSAVVWPISSPPGWGSGSDAARSGASLPSPSQTSWYWGRQHFYYKPQPSSQYQCVTDSINNTRQWH